MRVVFSDAALSDLNSMADYIGRDSWEQAEAFVLAIRDRCLSLASHPHRYPAVDVLESNLRKLVHRGYLVFYHVSADMVEVIHIIEGSRDWEQLLLNEVRPKD